MGRKSLRRGRSQQSQMELGKRKYQTEGQARTQMFLRSRLKMISIDCVVPCQRRRADCCGDRSRARAISAEYPVLADESRHRYQTSTKGMVQKIYEDICISHAIARS